MLNEHQKISKSKISCMEAPDRKSMQERIAEYKIPEEKIDPELISIQELLTELKNNIYILKMT